MAGHRWGLRGGSLLKHSFPDQEFVFLVTMPRCFDRPWTTEGNATVLFRSVDVLCNVLQIEKINNGIIRARPIPEGPGKLRRISRSFAAPHIVYRRVHSYLTALVPGVLKNPRWIEPCSTIALRSFVCE